MDLKKLPKSRKEAIEKGERFYFTGEPCSRGHLSKRSAIGTSYRCAGCAKEDNYKWRQSHTDEYNEKQKLYNKRYREKNREKYNAYMLAYDRRRRKEKKNGKQK